MQTKQMHAMLYSLHCCAFKGRSCTKRTLSSHPSSCAGVKLILTPTTTALFAAAGMLAPDGRCKTLSAAADGYGRGEACVTFVLQLHGSGGEAGSADQSPARDDDRGLVLLKGTAVGQDGRSSSLTAPNGPAQQATVTASLAEAATAGQARLCVADTCSHRRGQQVMIASSRYHFIFNLLQAVWCAMLPCPASQARQAANGVLICAGGRLPAAARHRHDIRRPHRGRCCRGRAAGTSR